MNNPQDTIPKILVRNIPLDLLHAVEEALEAGAERAFSSASGMDDGHLPHVVGQMRHFHMNESFYRALKAGGYSPSEVKGNSIITGRAGIVTIARFNIPIGMWINGRRSNTRLQLSYANKAIEPLVQPELFHKYEPPTEIVAFFVSCFSGSLQVQPEKPISIQIAVPDRDMRGWLFRESLNDLIKRYNSISESQIDSAYPKLKKQTKKGSDGQS